MVETSGVLTSFDEKGGLRVEYVDYGVSEFGGGDFQSIYDLDKQNADKLAAHLNSLGYGDVKEGLEALFGKKFSDDGFCALCKKLGIKYEHFTWFD